MKQAGKYFFPKVCGQRHLHILVGYHERAFGCLQAIVEFTLFQPRALRSSEDTSFGDLIEEFCEFWDTEVARFGEEVLFDCFIGSMVAKNGSS